MDNDDDRQKHNPPELPPRPLKRRRMDDQSDPQESYSRQREDRRHTSYSPASCKWAALFLPRSLSSKYRIAARLPHSQQLLGDLSMSRQSTSASANYPQAGSMSHTPYDPVHDPYNVPRMPSSSQSGSIDPYGAPAFPRDDRQQHHYGYSTTTRDDVHFRPAGLPRLDDARRERLQYTPSHELESLSYRAPTHPASQAMHSFRVQTASQGGGDPHSAYSGAVPETPSTYPTLPPLSTQAEDRAGSRRIVMACHQCRARKIRCDAERPSCKNCVRRREECRYDEKPKRRGPDKVPGSRMRSCKSKKQGGDASPSEPSGSGSFYRSSDA